MRTFDYPLLLKPIPVPKVWGGGRLAHIPDRHVPDSAEPIGECWDVSTWPTAPDNPALGTVTPIANGPLAGTPLDQVVDVPVVVKLLDSGDVLSVQSHPVQPDVHKDEMWYVLEADEGAYLYLGLKDNADRERLCALISSPQPDEDQVLGLLARHDGLRHGSHFSVPTGTVHALGPGLLTFEISEKSQVTYRLYDYNRKRSCGKLDISEGCASIMAVRPDLPVLDHGLRIDGAAQVELITQFPTFCVALVTGDAFRVSSAEHMHLVTASDGDLKISGPGRDWDIVLPYSFTCLVPPVSRAYSVDTQGSGEALISPLAD